VTDLIRPEPKLIWRLEARDADDETETFEVTDDHPWYVEGVGWVETKDLRAGQRIETADDRGLDILEIAPTDRVERTYNLTVDGLHTFLVGEDGAVVHNCPKLRGLVRELQEHRQKLDDYLRNPLAHDNKGFLRNAPTPEIAARVYQARVLGLVGQIRNFENQILRGFPY
jgi:hypothetical protein